MIATWVRERMKDCFSPMPCLSVGLSVCLSICHLSVYFSTSICPFVICLSICLTVFVHLSSVCLSVCLFICHLYVCLSIVICLSIHLSFVCLSVLPVHLSVCVCLSVFCEYMCVRWLCVSYTFTVQDGDVVGWQLGLALHSDDQGTSSPTIRIKRVLLVKGKSNVLTTIHQGAKDIGFELALMDVWKWEISWPSSVSLRTFKKLILICQICMLLTWEQVHYFNNTLIYLGAFTRALIMFTNIRWVVNMPSPKLLLTKQRNWNKLNKTWL